LIVRTCGRFPGIFRNAESLALDDVSLVAGRTPERDGIRLLHRRLLVHYSMTRALDDKDLIERLRSWKPLETAMSLVPVPAGRSATVLLAAGEGQTTRILTALASMFPTRAARILETVVEAHEAPTYVGAILRAMPDRNMIETIGMMDPKVVGLVIAKSPDIRWTQILFTDSTPARVAAAILNVVDNSLARSLFRSRIERTVSAIDAGQRPSIASAWAGEILQNMEEAPGKALIASMPPDEQKKILSTMDPKHVACLTDPESGDEAA
jgi:hypothetical protein